MKPTPKLDKCIELLYEVKRTLDEALDRAVGIAGDKEMRGAIRNAKTLAEGIRAYYSSKYIGHSALSETDEDLISGILDKEKELKNLTRSSALLRYILFPERTYPNQKHDVTSTTKTKNEALEDLTNKELWTGGEHFDEVFEVLKMDMITIKELRDEFKDSCGDYSKILEYVDRTYVEHSYILSERIPAWASLLWVSKKDIAEYHRRVKVLSDVELLTMEENKEFFDTLYHLKEAYNFVLNNVHVMYDRLKTLDSSNLNKENNEYIELHRTLSEYISGDVNSFVHIMKHKALGQEKQMNWIGAKDEAYIFATHFNIKISKMNECFNFGTVKLDSNNKPRKDLKSYKMYGILSEYDKSIK